VNTSEALVNTGPYLMRDAHALHTEAAGQAGDDRGYSRHDVNVLVAVEMLCVPGCGSQFQGLGFSGWRAAVVCVLCVGFVVGRHFEDELNGSSWKA